MWLPKDERKVLTIFCLVAEKHLKTGRSPTDTTMYELGELAKVFRSPNYKREVDGLVVGSHTDKPFANTDELPKEVVDKWIEEYKGFLDDIAVLNATIAALAMRSMIEPSRHRGDSMPIGIMLTIKGYDLGRKYSRRFTSSGLWFAEYKDHWIWILVSFFGGMLGALVVHLLTGD